MTKVNFYHGSSATIQGVSVNQLSAIMGRLINEVGISPIQLCESASYSMAMVARYALGLSAHGGQVCAVINDSIAGWVTLGCARHLATSGSRVRVIFLMDPENHGPELPHLLRPLQFLGVPTEHWSCYPDVDSITNLLSDCHTLLCGLFKLPSDRQDDSVSAQTYSQFIDIFNEHQIPIHSVLAPLGVNGDTGASDHPLYSSSTLSLGLPLSGLKPGAELAGRHYVCDISLHQSMVDKDDDIVVPDWLFSEQPVVQIYPTSPTKE